jgi:hypothetical protein
MKGERRYSKLQRRSNGLGGEERQVIVHACRTATPVCVPVFIRCWYFRAEMQS